MSVAARGKASGLPARRASLGILSLVLRKRRTLDFALSESLSRATLDERDSGFARAIAINTLRHFGVLHALIDKFVTRAPLPHKAGPTIEILLAGACELLILKTPAHAAVDAANRLAQEDAKAVHFKPLINAVLRRIDREGAGILERLDAAKLSLPDWMWSRMSEHYGEQTARAIAEAHLARPPLDLTLKTDDSSHLDSLKGDALGQRCMRFRDLGKVEAISGYKEGSWWVQDFAAGLPAQLLGDVKDKVVIDLCAAPGGKTAQLSAAGAQVIAIDASKERMGIVRSNLTRLDLQAKMITADARDWRPVAPAPFVLLDAPCTATGTIRRHPELPLIKSAADTTVQENLQRELFDAAAEMTSVGGTLVYAVCSLEPEEGVEQVDAFLARQSNFERDPLRAEEVPDAAFISPEGDLRTLPHYWASKGGMDGFYAARLRRRA